MREPDVAKLLGVKRVGGGTSLYRSVIRYDPCAYCGLPAPTGRFGGHQVDHIRARFRGGPSHWTNYTSACEFCNASKYDMVLGILLDLRDLRHLIRSVA